MTDVLAHGKRQYLEFVAVEEAHLRLRTSRFAVGLEAVDPVDDGMRSPIDHDRRQLIDDLAQGGDVFPVDGHLPRRVVHIELVQAQICVVGGAYDGNDLIDYTLVTKMPELLESPIPREASDYACIDLVNSTFTNYREAGRDGLDRLPLREWQQWFMNHHQLTLASGRSFPAEELAQIRTGLRSTLQAWALDGTISSGAASELDRTVRRTAHRHRVGQISTTKVNLTTEPVKRDQDWLIASVAMSAVSLMATGQHSRLKVCGNPACSWMFYDDTLNRSKRYCSLSPCGTLVRIRRYRSRS